jgi:tryptophan synthase alpha chain
MTHRIARVFKYLKKRNQKAFIVYLTAGDPRLRATEKLIYALEKTGVDLVEIGVPFSDPLADGPVIQAASERALCQGTTVSKILKLVRNVRKHSDLPVVLMTYLNPIFHYGLKHFAAAARRAGVDGLVVPDLPPEEGRAISALMRAEGLDLIYLVAPTSTAERRRRIARQSRGFVYYVSLTGVTGLRKTLPVELERNIRLVKRISPLPVCVGFGVSTPAQARAAAKFSDGVIVGSALVRQLSLHPQWPAGTFAKRFVAPFARALGKRV